MSDWVAIWGAVTGTIGTATGVIALFLQARADRTSVQVHLAMMEVVQPNELGRLIAARPYIQVRLVNSGRRPVSIASVAVETADGGGRVVDPTSPRKIDYEMPTLPLELSESAQVTCRWPYDVVSNDSVDVVAKDTHGREWRAGAKQFSIIKTRSLDLRADAKRKRETSGDRQ